MIVAFTGHRPDKIGTWNAEIDAALDEFFDREKPSAGVVGMADGFDTMAGLKCVERGVPFIACVPFKGHRSHYDQDTYRFLISKALRVHISAPHYQGPWVMQRRNEVMVDISELLATCWDGSPGGTYNCIKYARHVGRMMRTVWGKDGWV